MSRRSRLSSSDYLDMFELPQSTTRNTRRNGAALTSLSTSVVPATARPASASARVAAAAASGSATARSSERETDDMRQLVSGAESLALMSGGPSNEPEIPPQRVWVDGPFPLDWMEDKPKPAEQARREMNLGTKGVKPHSQPPPHEPFGWAY